jgi:hypothetical protein
VAKDKIMTREDLIIEMMPFSDELKQWCNNHSEFADALKIIYPERFITLQAIAIHPTSQKIKFWVYLHMIIKKTKINLNRILL